MIHHRIFDLNHIYQIGNQTKILAWYDNEWGFSKRMLEMSLYIKNLSKDIFKRNCIKLRSSSLEGLYVLICLNYELHTY